MADSAREVFKESQIRDIDGLFFDATAAGTNLEALWPHTLQFFVDGIKFQMKPLGEEEMFDEDYTNGQFFANRAIQMGWNLRMRAIRTDRWLNGDLGDEWLPECLLISDKIVDPIGLFAEISQPTWKKSGRGIMIEKMHKGEPSPDRFDALCLAFHRDIEFGISVFDDLEAA